MSRVRAFTMPKWGIEMTEGTLGEWMVQEGAAFTKGTILCLIETDKITNEVEAEFDSVLRKIVVEPGTTLPVGALLAVFADAATPPDEIEAFAASFKAADTRVAAGASKSKPAAATPEKSAKIDTRLAISPKALAFAEENAIELADVEGSGRSGRITHQDVYQASRPAALSSFKGPLALEANDGAFASPLAKRLASIHGLSLAGVKGTGPRGRICKADVLALVPAPASGAARTAFVPAENRPDIRPMDKIRKVVARRLTEAKATIPHFYLRASAGIDALLSLRKSANLVLGVKASINDFLVLAAAKALAEHPDVNIQVHGDAIHYFPHADIAVAVATEKGLVTPIVRSADLMRIDDIAAATKALAEKARIGRLSYDDLDGGTFTVSNLGMFGIDQFDAIINPPQGAILAVGAAAREWREGDGGAGCFETRIALSLSLDHRAIDGAAGARFMATLKELIETPEALFA